MPTWFDIRARLFPWLWNKEFDTHQRDAALAVEREQQQLEPLIAAQTSYLERRGQVNGFTRQLRAGFQGRGAGE